MRFAGSGVQKIVRGSLTTILSNLSPLTPGGIGKKCHHIDGSSQGLRRSLLHRLGLHDDCLGMTIEKTEPQTFNHQTQLNPQCKARKIAPLHKVSVL
jgi:hypothetical protein